MTLVDWASASRALKDGNSTGDGCLVRPRPGGILVAALDALGHGPDAAAAAAVARRSLETDRDSSLIRLLQRCHADLRGTRGVALSLAFFDGPEATMTWLGVGNVHGLLVRSEPRDDHHQAALLQHAGIVGRTLPRVTPGKLPVKAGDVLILATDGIAPRFGGDLLWGETPQRQADHILERHYRGDDDGLAMVVVYKGNGA